MFDTLRNRNALNGCYSGGLAGCGNHRARRDRAWSELQTTKARIPELERQIETYKNGQLQAEYVTLERKQQDLRNQKNELNAKIQQARLRRDAWATNPSQQAQLEGLGWNPFKAIGKAVKNVVRETHKLVSCVAEEDAERAYLRELEPLKQILGQREQDVKNWQDKLSADSMNKMRQVTQNLQREVDDYTDRLNTINKEIQGHIDNYKKQKEAEAMAKIVGEDAESKENEKNTNTLLITGTVGVGVVGLAVIVKMLSKPKAKKVTA